MSDVMTQFKKIQEIKSSDAYREIHTEESYIQAKIDEAGLWTNLGGAVLVAGLLTAVSGLAGFAGVEMGLCGSFMAAAGAGSVIRGVVVDNEVNARVRAAAAKGIPCTFMPVREWNDRTGGNGGVSEGIAMTAMLNMD